MKVGGTGKLFVKTTRQAHQTIDTRSKPFWREKSKFFYKVNFLCFLNPCWVRTVCLDSPPQPCGGEGRAQRPSNRAPWMHRCTCLCGRRETRYGTFAAAFSKRAIIVAWERDKHGTEPGAHLLPLLQCVCLFVRVGGGQQWRTCATRDYEPRKEGEKKGSVSKSLQALFW